MDVIGLGFQILILIEDIELEDLVSTMNKGQTHMKNKFIMFSQVGF
jgi:hypothetical protein